MSHNNGVMTKFYGELVFGSQKSRSVKVMVVWVV
jgi:hypothetical protein